MSRAQKNVRRGSGKTASVQRQPTLSGEGKGNGVKRITGTERPQAVTHFPTDMADPQARVIKSRD